MQVLQEKQDFEWHENDLIEAFMNHVDELSTTWKDKTMDDFRVRIESTDYCEVCTNKILEETDKEITETIDSSLQQLVQVLDAQVTVTEMMIEDAFVQMQECESLCEGPECPADAHEQLETINTQQQVLELEIERLEQQLEDLEKRKVELLAECPMREESSEIQLA